MLLQFLQTSLHWGAHDKMVILWPVQPSRPNRLTISLEMTLFLLLSPGLILLGTFSLLDRLLTIFTLNVKQCCFKQHSKEEWKNNKFDLEISLLPKSKLELKKLEHFFFKMCHNLVFMERETFDTFSTLIFSTYSPGSKLNSRNLPAPITNGLEGGTWVRYNSYRLSMEHTIYTH